MPEKLEVGRVYNSQARVEEWMTAQKAGNKRVDVLSTPMLIQLIEEAALQCVLPTLTEQQITLGTHFEIAHLAPSPVGFIIRIEVEVVAIDGRRITFAVAAFDEREKIADGTHERYITERAKFLERIEDKLS
jgi:fluoroacetyl-CoA thioesterase